MACAIRSNIEADALSPERPLSVWCWRARERERKGGTPSVTRRGAGPSTQHQSKMEAVGGRVWLPTRWALFGFTRARDAALADDLATTLESACTPTLR
jgi:hypothetical protein